MSRIRRSGRFCWLQRQSGGRLFATDTNGTGASKGCKKGEAKKKKSQNEEREKKISYKFFQRQPLHVDSTVYSTLFTYFYGLFLYMDHKLSNRRVLAFFSAPSRVLFSTNVDPDATIHNCSSKMWSIPQKCKIFITKTNLQNSHLPPIISADRAVCAKNG